MDRRVARETIDIYLFLDNNVHIFTDFAKVQRNFYCTHYLFN